MKFDDFYTCFSQISFVWVELDFYVLGVAKWHKFAKKGDSTTHIHLQITWKQPFFKTNKICKQLFWKIKRDNNFLKLHFQHSTLPTFNTHKLAHNITSTKTTQKSCHPTNWSIRERERDIERILSWSIVHEHCHVLLCLS